MDNNNSIPNDLTEAGFNIKAGGAYDSRGINIGKLAEAKTAVDNYRDEIKTSIDKLVTNPQVDAGFKGNAQIEAIKGYLEACKTDLNKIYDYLGTFGESLLKIQANYESQDIAAGQVATSAEQGFSNEGTIATQAEGGVTGFGG